ncbi:desmoglein-3 [Eschrichtius robustus]|uniref:desmoglein-3 n=1 Tax=Eschrichtius robustus TaxID=9764 RepID=UPI0035C0C541
MAWFLFRTTGALTILMVVLLVHGEWRIETKGQHGEYETAVQQGKRRYKREWVKFARPCREEEDNSKRNPIATITSDFQVNQDITYHITGIGIDQPPLGIFIVDRNTGEINITTIVDREETPSFQITCRALSALGQDVEKPLILTVKILDINDNAPVFSTSMFVGEIEERSSSNSLVMILNATDADEPNNLNSKIAFKIISQEPAGAPMFLLSRHTGEVHTLTNSLDREQVSRYNLVVHGADRDGEGLATQCECNITVKDVNDNIPTFRKPQYSASIKENTLSSDLLRFQVIDLDEEFTDNWFAVYSFTSGNDGNWFEIQTDPITNEGIFKVVKSLDYEQLQTLKLNVTVKNKAEFHKSIISQHGAQPAQLIIQVINMREGIVFRPPFKIFVVPQGISGIYLIGYIVGSYEAIDEDTGQAALTVRYILGRNDGGLLIIGSNTAQIEFAKTIRWDATFMVNKTITAEVLAIDKITGKTSTGTICVQLPYFNENCPIIVPEKEIICSSSPSVVVKATLPDNVEYSGPYTFSQKKTTGQPVWEITTLDATSAMLRGTQQVYPGVYRISLVIVDSKGMWCETPESLALEVCWCDNSGTCRTLTPTETPNPPTEERPVRLGPAAIGLLLLGLLLLLLALLLLLTCYCGTGPFRGVTGGFNPVPDGSEGTIRPWGIEGAQPEDKEITNIYVPPITANGVDFTENSEVRTNTYAGGTVVEGALRMEVATNPGAAPASGAAAEFGAAAGLSNDSTGRSGTMRTRHSMEDTNRDYGEGAIDMNFLDSYFSQKAFACAEEDDGQEANDCLLIYDNEGMGAPGSPIGSLGSCSFIADEFDDSCLDSLSPKFKKLAEISLGMDEEAKNSQPPTKESGSRIESRGQSVQVQQSESVRCQTLSGSQGASVLSASGSVLQPAISIRDPLQHGGYLVTETCSASGSQVQSSTAVFDPLLTQNVIVRERVICPSSSVPGNLHGLAELQGPGSKICTEDPCSLLM